MGNLAYQYENKFELLNGKIVNMSPSPVINHNIAVVNITHIFLNFLQGKPCMVFADGVDVHLSEKDTVIPDVMIVCNKDIIKYDAVYGPPDLVVEVLSPSTSKNDKGYKKDLYQRSGVKEYWIVDTKNLSIEVYLQKNDQYILDNIYIIYPDYLIKKMSEEEKSDIPKEFKTSLFSDLIIQIEDVFEGTLNYI